MRPGAHSRRQRSGGAKWQPKTRSLETMFSFPCGLEWPPGLWQRYLNAVGPSSLWWGEASSVVTTPGQTDILRLCNWAWSILGSPGLMLPNHVRPHGAVCMGQQDTGLASQNHPPKRLEAPPGPGMPPENDHQATVRRCCKRRVLDSSPTQHSEGLLLSCPFQTKVFSLFRGNSGTFSTIEKIIREKAKKQL